MRNLWIVAVLLALAACSASDYFGYPLPDGGKDAGDEKIGSEPVDAWSPPYEAGADVTGDVISPDVYDAGAVDVLIPDSAIADAKEEEACVPIDRATACGSNECGSAPDNCGHTYQCGANGGGCPGSSYSTCGVPAAGKCFVCTRVNDFDCTGQDPNHPTYPFQCNYVEYPPGYMYAPPGCHRYSSPEIDGGLVARECCYNQN